MNLIKYIIIPFQPIHQRGVDKLFSEIQSEFSERVFSDSSLSITESSAIAGRMYWIALNGEHVIGTIGLLILDNRFCALKSLFVGKDYRGSHAGVADKLLQTAVGRAVNFNCREIYLGTMKQFEAAQKFYEKNHFAKIHRKDLPPDLNPNPVDTVFYRRVL